MDNVILNEEKKEIPWKKFFIWIVFGLLAVGFILYATVIKPNQLEKQVNALLEDNDGIAALAILEDLGSRASDELWAEARLDAIGQYLEEDTVSKALELYPACGSGKGEADILLSEYARKLLSQGDGIGALEIFGAIGDSAEAEDVALARELALWHSLKNADTEKAYPLLAEYAWSGTEAAENLFAHTEGLDEAEGDSLAGTLGAYYTDLNEQLDYCGALYSAGYDMGAVYPDGVVVDVDLTAYDHFTCVQNDKPVSNPSVGKTLVFSKTMKEDFSFPSSFLASCAPNVKDRETWSVRLLPGLLYQVPENIRASSWEECESLLLLEHMYYPSGSFTIVTYRNNKKAYETEYNHYALVEMMALYEKDAPDKAISTTSSVTLPKAAEKDFLDQQDANSTYSWMNIRNMLGQPDPEFTPLTEQAESIVGILELLPLFYSE